MMKSNLSTIDPKTESTAPTTREQFDHFKSIYYLIKGKRDSDIKLFNEYKQFRLRDINELNDKIYQRLKLQQIVTDTTNVTIGLSNKEIKSFCWREFSDFDKNISASTKYISLEWEFNIILPNQEHAVPQTHSIRIRIGNNLRPNEMIQVIFQGSEETEMEEMSAQMVCKIDFINAQICSDLKSLITGWYDALPKNSEDHKMVRFLLKHSVKIQQTIIVLYLLAGVILLNYLTRYFVNVFSLKTPAETINLFYLIATSSIIFLYLAYISGKLYADRVLNKTINKFRRDPMFEITKGDENRKAEINTNNGVLIRKLIGDFCVAIILNLASFGLGKVFPSLAELFK